MPPKKHLCPLPDQRPIAQMFAPPNNNQPSDGDNPASAVPDSQSSPKSCKSPPQPVSVTTATLADTSLDDNNNTATVNSNTCSV